MELAGKEALEGVVFVEADAEKPVFRRYFEESFPKLSYSPVAYLCYCAMAVVLNGASVPGALAGPEALRSAILGLKSVDLPDGVLPIIDREIQVDVRTRVIRGGRVE